MYEPPFPYSAMEFPKVNLAAAARALNCGLHTFGGLLFLAIGIVGIYLPGIPTTGPVLLALFLITRGNPHLREYLQRYRFFDLYFEYLDGTRVMSTRARVYASACMWLSIIASSVVISLMVAEPFWLLLGCVFGGVVGTIVIARFRPVVGLMH